MQLSQKAILDQKVKPFGMQDKLGYALGDFSSALLFNFIGSYLLVFYTDVFGISAAAVGTLMAVSRIWDAINDPMMGIIVDKRKKSKNGKFRPFIKYMGIPLGIFTILTFFVIPNIPQNMKLPYAYITYIGFGMAYTAINIPYGSLAAVMTKDAVERTELSTWRSLGSTLGVILLMAITPKLIFNAEGVVTAKGFLTAALLYAIVSYIGYLGCYTMTTERVEIEERENAPKVGFVKTVKTLAKNRALIALMISSLGILTAMFLPGALNAYLFKDYFGNTGLLSMAGLVPIVGTFAMMPFSGKLVGKFGKKNVATYSLVVCIFAYVIMFFFPSKNPWVYIGLVTLNGFGSGLYNMVIYAIVGDVIDYQEFLSGKREDGTVYAAYSLSRKLVQAIVGTISGFALAAIGYQSGAATQTAEVANSIRVIITLVPLVGLVFGALCMKFIYNLNNKTLAEVNAELERRRA